MADVSGGERDLAGELKNMLGRLEALVKEASAGGSIPREKVEEAIRIIGDLKDIAGELEESKARLEVEELREVGNLIKTLGSTARELITPLIDKLMEALDGKRLGENVSTLYRSLKESGMPDQLVESIVREYVGKALSLANIGDVLSRVLAGFGKPPSMVKKEEEKEK
ncbi:hypothetical protein ACSU1N_04035 [Thermogladius sp. 4427co]|uniref:hypothetical protein n=1 Tax=Thermogladius sp. 4427co TaxID=3450718 RepID=UPI003F79EF42